jgi:assimilatory nitrate reductase catalytic subunit
VRPLSHRTYFVHETLASTAARTHCPYCAMQCGMLIGGTSQAPEIAGDPDFPVNRGALCIKGWTSVGAIAHPERLTSPLVRDASGGLMPATWDEALDRITTVIRTLQATHGRDGVGVFGSGALTNEKAYLLGKFARVALRTRHIDYNGRFCMASAAAAANAAFGIDRGLPFPLADVAEAGAILLVGSNVAETLPPAMQYFDAQRRAGGALIVVDPRRTPTAATATLHLPIAPGTDGMLANGLLHVLIRDGLVDDEYVTRRTAGFAAVKSAVAACWPGLVEMVTGVPERDVVRAAHLLASARSAMVLTARGPEQQAQGVANTLAFINIALALGQVGRRAGGFGCLTGQGNGQGGREHGQKSDQLPGYRSLKDPAARAHVGAVWGVDPETLPPPGVSAFELLDSLGTPDGPRALIVMGSNPVVSAPSATRIARRLAALDLLVVCDFFMSETAAMADVVLPVAMWAEEEGTVTNLEGRVLRRRRVFAPPAGVRTDLEVLSLLAARLGHAHGFAFEHEAAVFEELGRASAGGVADYRGISHDRIDAGAQLHWPCPDDTHPGTPRLFADRFPTPDGRARFHVVTPSAPAESPDRDYPLYLTTGRVLAQYQSGTQTRRMRELIDRAPSPRVEVHPITARQQGVAAGDVVTVRTRRGAAVLQVEITDTVRTDTLFVPFHWGGLGSANLLTNPALDPISRMPEFKVCAARLEARVSIAQPDTDAAGRSPEAAAVDEPVASLECRP